MACNCLLTCYFRVTFLSYLALEFWIPDHPRYADVSLFPDNWIAWHYCQTVNSHYFTERISSIYFYRISNHMISAIRRSSMFQNPLKPRIYVMAINASRSLRLTDHLLFPVSVQLVSVHLYVYVFFS